MWGEDGMQQCKCLLLLSGALANWGFTLCVYFGRYFHPQILRISTHVYSSFSLKCSWQMKISGLFFQSCSSMGSVQISLTTNIAFNYFSNVHESYLMEIPEFRIIHNRQNLMRITMRQVTIDWQKMKWQSETKIGKPLQRRADICHTTLGHSRIHLCQGGDLQLRLSNRLLPVIALIRPVDQNGKHFQERWGTVFRHSRGMNTHSPNLRQRWSS